MTSRLATRITTTAATTLLGCVGIIAWQFFSTAQLLELARESAISSWEASNPGEAPAVARFRENCLRGGSEDPANRIAVRPLTFSQCAQKIGNHSLARALDVARDSVEVPAPLRWL